MQKIYTVFKIKLPNYAIWLTENYPHDFIPNILKFAGCNQQQYAHTIITHKRNKNFLSFLFPFVL